MQQHRATGAGLKGDVSRAAWTAAATLGVALSASAWLAHADREAAVAAERRRTAEALAHQLASAVEPLLRAGDLTAARRAMLDAAGFPGILGARLLLPDGRVVADTSPRMIQVAELPARWSDVADPDRLRSAAPGVGAEPSASMLEPIRMDGRGTIFLAVTQAASIDAKMRPATAWLPVAGAALVLTLLSFRRLNRRLGSLLIMMRAIRVVADGGDTEAARVAADEGGDPAAWNQVLDRLDATERSERTAAARAAVGEGASTGGRGAAAAGGIVDVLPMGVLVLDAGARIRAANGAAAALLGLASREELVGRELPPALAHESVAAMLRAAAAGTGGGERAADVPHDGGNGVLRVSVRPLRKTDEGSLLLTLEDVTQQRVADASRNNFVAQATHELRAPLTNMRLALEEALDEEEQKLGVPAIARHLNVLNDETRRLERLVSEMLCVAEIEAGAAALREGEVRLDRLFDELRADHAPAAAGKNIALAFELPPKLPQLRGDREKIAAALHNLINNAIKYTPEGGAVSVKPRQEGMRLVVDVSDTGFGIAESDQPRIFERFYRARDARVGKITGTGLGLAFSREVARLHGGELTFKSELNRGTTFTLQLPAAAQAA